MSSVSDCMKPALLHTHKHTPRGTRPIKLKPVETVPDPNRNEMEPTEQLVSRRQLFRVP